MICGATLSVTTRLVRDVVGGITCGIISIFFGLSFAAVIFSGPLKPWLGQGIALTFMTTAIAAAVYSARSSMRFAIAGPDSSTTAVVAALAAAFAEKLLRSGVDAEHLIGPVLLALAFCSLVTGVFLYGLGFAHAGRAIRYVPYPVIGGFLGATGWLMTSGALRVIADIRLDALSFSDIGIGPNTAKIAAAAAVALGLLIVRRYGRHVLALPVLLTAAIAAFHAVLAALHVPLSEAIDAGWTFTPQASLRLSAPSLTGLSDFPWQVFSSQIGEIMAVAFVTTIAMLLNTTGIEIATKSEADLDKDLQSLGIANVASAALGGYVSCVSLSRSTINHACGARDRVAGFTLAGMAVVMLFLDPHFLGYVPKFVLGGLLLFAGLDLCYRWVIGSLRQLPITDYLSLVLIAIIIINWGFVAGVLVGIIIGCATFAVSASRVDAIKFSFDGSQYRSSLDRGVAELQILSQFGHELQGMSLHSYLFFGTTNRLYQHVKRLLARKERCRFLLFDFRLVTGMDSSATQSFAQIKTAAEAAGARIVFANITQEVEDLLRLSNILTRDIRIEPNLDRALEWCENEIINEHQRNQLASHKLTDWLAIALDSQEEAAVLAKSCKRLLVKAGDIIARQGEPSRSMHFIVNGRVGVLVAPPDGEPIRVRSLGSLTTVGEMGLITGQVRTATIEAEIDTELYELDAETYQQLAVEHPKLCQALLGYVVQIMSERLTFANRTIGVLRR
jgi:SulP family sulfate permease